MEKGTFATQWKKQIPEAVSKSGKPSGVSSSYSPICVLDSVEKLLECIIWKRLLPVVEEVGRMFTNSSVFALADALTNWAEEAIASIRSQGGTNKYCASITTTTQLNKLIGYTVDIATVVVDKHLEDDTAGHVKHQAG